MNTSKQMSTGGHRVKPELLDAYDKLTVGFEGLHNARAISRLMQISLETLRETTHSESLVAQNQLAEDLASLAVAAGAIHEMLTDTEDCVDGAQMKIRGIS